MARLALPMDALVRSHVIAAHLAPAFGLQGLCITSHIGMRLAQDVADGVHVACSQGVTHRTEVRGDPVRVLITTRIRNGLSHELFSDHCATSAWLRFAGAI